MSKLRHTGIKLLARGHGNGTGKHRRDSNPGRPCARAPPPPVQPPQGSLGFSTQAEKSRVRQQRTLGWLGAQGLPRALPSRERVDGSREGWPGPPDPSDTAWDDNTPLETSQTLRCRFQPPSKDAGAQASGSSLRGHSGAVQNFPRDPGPRREGGNCRLPGPAPPFRGLTAIFLFFLFFIFDHKEQNELAGAYSISREKNAKPPRSSTL